MLLPALVNVLAMPVPAFCAAFAMLTLAPTNGV